MKKKIFIIFFILILHILIFCCYKFFIPGNNKNIEDVSDLNNYISSIKEYKISHICFKMYWKWDSYVFEKKQ